MYLEIKNPNNLDLKDFCIFLKDKIYDYAMDENNQDKDLIQKWDNYFKENDLGWPKDQIGNPVAPSTKFIISKWFKNLETISTNGSYFLIPSEKIMLNSMEVSVDSLASRINFGVLGVKPYNYFDKVLNEIAARLPDIYEEYLIINQPKIKEE